MKATQIHSAKDLLAKKFGKEGTPEREKFNEEAYSYYRKEIMLNERKKGK